MVAGKLVAEGAETGKDDTGAAIVNTMGAVVTPAFVTVTAFSDPTARPEIAAGKMVI